jgi:peptidoglycan/LPS O-acetylase OafA/YrhL
VTQSLTSQHVFVRLNVARGMAALAVFASHIGSILFLRLIGNDHPAAVALSIVSRHAVLVFFLLSGNLITRSINLNIRRNGQFEFADYLSARIARIYPPFLGSVAICVMVWLLIRILHLPGAYPYGLPGDLFRIRDVFQFRPAEMIQAVVMRGGLLTVNGPLWSLFIECQIYVAVMAVAALSRRDLLSRVASILLALVVFGYLRDQMFFVAVWCVGALTALWIPGRRLTWTACLLSLAALGWIVLDRPELLGSRAETLPGQLVQLACCIVYAAMLFFLLPPLRYPRFLVATGNFSYSLYIIHFPLLMLALSLGQNWIGHSMARTWIVAGVATIAILSVTVPFAKVTEQQARFKRLLLAQTLRIPKFRAPPDHP